MPPRRRCRSNSPSKNRGSDDPQDSTSPRRVFQCPRTVLCKSARPGSRRREQAPCGTATAVESAAPVIQGPLFTKWASRSALKQQGVRRTLAGSVSFTAARGGQAESARSPAARAEPA